MWQRAILFSLSWLWLVATARAELIDFDDLPSPPGDVAPIPDDYRGLIWTNWQYFDSQSGSVVVAGTGWEHGAVSTPHVGSNVSAGAVVLSVSTGTFNLNRMYITSTCLTGLNVRVQGEGVSASYDETVVVDTTAPTLFEFGFKAIDTLTVSSSGGVDAGVCVFVDQNFFAIDDMTIDEPIACPESGVLDSFALYRGKNNTSLGPKFTKFGPVTLTDAVLVGGKNYNVRAAKGIALPTELEASIGEPNVVLREYLIKNSEAASSFTKRKDVLVNVQTCDDAVVTLVKPVSVWIPTAMDEVKAVAAPDPNQHGVDAFTCYKAVAQRRFTNGDPAPKFPKKVQMDAEDEFQDRRYDLKKISKVCLATSISNIGTPIAIQDPNAALLCYKAKLSKKQIAQQGCGPAIPAGPEVSLDQERHVKRAALFTSNVFGDARVGTIKESEICVPATVELP